MPVPHQVGMSEAAKSAASGSKNIAATATGVVLLAGTGLRLFRNVPDEHVGVIKHFGRGKRIRDSREISIGETVLRRGHKAGETYGIKPPGSRRVIPLIQSMVLVSNGINNVGLGHIEFDTADKFQMKTEAWVNFHIMPGEDYAWRALYRVNKPEELGQRLRSHALGHLTFALTSMTEGDLRDSGVVQERLDDVREQCTNHYEFFGAYPDSVEITAPSFTAGEKQVQGQRIRAEAEQAHAQNIGRIATYIEQNGLFRPE